MKSHKRMNLIYSLILTAVAVFSGCDRSISEYRAGNEAEREIISVLTQYQDAKNQFDMEKLLFLLHDKGKFSFACGMMVSKSELKKVLPVFWAEMTSEKLGIVPMAHECLNGDYYKSGELKNPEIRIHNDTAKATVRFTKRFSSSLLLYFSMVRENDRWLITRTEWGPS